MMKNIPRIYINQELASGKIIPIDKDVLHYLTRVMRTDECLVFNNGIEYTAKIINQQLSIISATNHADPSNDLTFCFAPIKKTDDMLNMVTQMGVAKLQPVITERTVAHHINWDRMKKIIIQASEQSNRNSVPVLLNPIKFTEFLKEQGTGTKNSLIFADERFAHNSNHQLPITNHVKTAHAVLMGPEGGFSDTEFAALDTAGAVGISLGKTILRAETAAVVAVTRIIYNG